MKKIIYLLLLLFTYTQSIAQVDETLKNMQLYDGSVYVTYGHRITQVFSELKYKMGVGFFPKTNIAYLSCSQLTSLLQDTAKQKNWTEEEYFSALNQLKNTAKTGRLILYVERYNLYETNNKFFFIIIRDTLENNLLEYQLPAHTAELVSSDVFSNWAYININIDLPEQFYVYVNHKLSENLSDTKFLVQQSAAPLTKPK